MIVGDLSYTVFRLASVPITVTRGTAGSNDGAGHYTPGATSPITLQANVQPAMGRDLMRLEEGFRTRDIVAIFTQAALQTTDAVAGTPADLVTLSTGTYEVQHVEPWPHGNLYRCLAAKVGA